MSVIEIAEKEIRRDGEDLTRLKKRYPGYDFIRIAEDEVEEPAAAPVADISEFEKAILAMMVEDAAKEWTSRTVLTGLSASGRRIPNNDDAAMNAVSYALSTLLERGSITRVHVGRGRDPHRYTIASQVSPGSSDA